MQQIYTIILNGYISFKKENNNFVTMVQRIQSIYLVLIVVCSIGVTIVLKPFKTPYPQILALNLSTQVTIFLRLITAFFIFSALMAFLSIFQYRRRKLQLLLGRIIIVINLISQGILIYFTLGISKEASSVKHFIVPIPLLIIALSVMANRAIQKDEDLIKSINRLR